MSRNIPGGTFEFDLSSHCAWQHLPLRQRKANLQDWVATLAPLAEARESDAAPAARRPPAAQDGGALRTSARQA
jgi:hypothetical protein